jgi:hypothetical protein
MRRSFVIALAVLAATVQAAPVAAEDGTSTAWFNFQIVHDPERPIASGNEPLIETDEFAVRAQCDGMPLIVGFFEEEVVISFEARDEPAERHGITTEPASGDEVFLSVGHELVWYDAHFMPRADPAYIVFLRLFATEDFPDSRCQFSGEMRMVELPVLKVVE